VLLPTVPPLEEEQAKRQACHDRVSTLRRGEEGREHQRERELAVGTDLSAVPVVVDTHHHQLTQVMRKVEEVLSCVTGKKKRKKKERETKKNGPASSSLLFTHTHTHTSGEYLHTTERRSIYTMGKR